MNTITENGSLYIPYIYIYIYIVYIYIVCIYVYIYIVYIYCVYIYLYTATPHIFYYYSCSHLYIAVNIDNVQIILTKQIPRISCHIPVATLAYMHIYIYIYIYIYIDLQHSNGNTVVQKESKFLWTSNETFVGKIIIFKII